MIRKPGFCLLMFAAIACAQLPSDDAIRGILKQRVDDYHQSVGIVVGMIDQKGRKVVSYGALEKGDSRPLNGDTVFEIGSVTKVFTSLLMSDMVKRGDAALTDPVVKYLPAGTKVPQRNGRQITLEDLSTHTSGLPRIPSNMKMTDPANPYADYTPE
ncbi:MAG TPA: serine hydrolase, partial [Bryobacteraceae bacterium]|nr:serine hydrolase [Bryobacteraceae bacterium]